MSLWQRTVTFARWGAILAPLALAQAANACDLDLTNAYGPFDYTNPDHFHNRLPVVEQHHFSRHLVNPATTKVGDLDYTLRAFPNHHRALFTALRYELLRSRPGGHERYRPLFKSLDCYFQRAAAWRPRDARVHMLYGIYKHRKNELDEALTAYQNALQLDPRSVELKYNLGLLYLDRGELAQAKKYAKEAYEGGYPLPGLKQKLAAQNQWP